MAGTLTISGLAAGLPSGIKTIGPQTMTGAAVIDDTIQVALSSGDNTISLPSGVTVTAAYIVLPSTNTVQLKLRTNLDNADGGVPFGPTGFVVWPIYTGTTSLIINAASSGAGTIVVEFI